MSPQTLKNLVKQLVKEKYRSRNLIVFGLEENEKEIISEKIGDLLETMGERPKTVAYRLGNFFVGEDISQTGESYHDVGW